jgi:choice-of-anchor B domain-containing protein
MKRLLFLVLFFESCLVFSQTYPSQNINLISHIDPQSTVGIGGDNRKYSGCWGWHQASTGKEYGIVGTSAGVFFVDISSPATPTVCDYVDGKHGCTWREMKTYQNYCYVVSDDASPNQFQIIDLQYLPDSVHVIHSGTTYFERGHTIWIDKDKMYIGSETKLGGAYNSMCIYSLATPTNPTFLRSLVNDAPFIGTVHDMFVNNDTVFASCGNTGLYIFKYNTISNSFTQLGSYVNYSSGSAYNHSGFITKDKKYFVFADEVPGSLPARMLDIQNIANPVLTSTFNAHPATTPHNPYVVGNRWALISSYMDGLNIFDISNPFNVTLAGYFDSHPQSGFNTGDYSGGPYRGNWGAYPYFPSGLILALDMQNGVFVLDPSALYTVIGTKENNSVDKFLNLYPNPAQNFVKIMTNVNEEAELSITNILGQTLLQRSYTHFGSQDLDVSQLPAGTYFVSLRTNSKSFSKKLIINTN